jgi:hypothetical protein
MCAILRIRAELLYVNERMYQTQDPVEIGFLQRRAEYLRIIYSNLVSAHYWGVI